MHFHKTVNFKFSSESWAWLLHFFEPIVLRYQTSAPDISALVTFSNHEFQHLVQSSAWGELVRFLQEYDIHDVFPQMFIYKQLARPRETVLGNPHIDTSGQGSNSTTHDVPTRFNILMQGDEDTEMVWWSHHRDSSVVISSTFVNPAGVSVQRLQARGTTLSEKWDAAGPPAARCNMLLKKQQLSSFVRTDRLHALNWTGANPRLIFSIRSFKSWQF